MPLSSQQIRLLCQTKNMIIPFDESQLNSASYDVRLGDELMIETVSSTNFVRVPIAGYTAENPWPLYPGQFCLGCTQEILNMPDDDSDSIAGQFALKSSRGREGYSHALSAWIDPGFSASRLTLELHNLLQLNPVPLYPGLLIGQIVFVRMEEKPDISYSKVGHYNNCPTVMPSHWT
jgi:dCTP deaminase